MSEVDEKITELQTRLENLVRTQIGFQQEISRIRYELNVLRAAERPDVKPEPQFREEPQNVPPATKPETSREPVKPPLFDYGQPQWQSSTTAFTEQGRTQLEKFIGENLISKIGIGVLIIGVGIGAKYAIDNNLISPLMRIIFGYVIGFGLLFFAVRLKPKYLNFSAVLLSGGMAIMYFVTYFAFSLYSLFSQTTAFALMLIFTIFTISSAIVYSRQIIAHVGLVGAYAIPFLLSDNSGNYAFLFTYIAIINTGILAISVRKYWKPLFYTSFIFTWAIFYGWFTTSYLPERHFTLGMGFAFVFFLIFYVTFLIYKIVSEQNLAIENIALVLSNSFIFYSLGYLIIDKHPALNQYLGLYTIGNAAIHLGFAVAAGRIRHISKDVLYLLTALVLTFVTIAIPVQFDGNRITLIWTAEALFLFGTARTRQLELFEYFSFPLMALATFSLFSDWIAMYDRRSFNDLASIAYPLMNGVFVMGICYVAAFAGIWFVNKNERYEPVLDQDFRKFINYAVAAAGLFVLYNTFRNEIDNYYHYQMAQTAIPGDETLYGYEVSRTNPDLSLFNIIWQINYTMLFATVLSFIDIRWVKDRILSVVNLVFGALSLAAFLTVGLYLLGELRESYSTQDGAFVHDSFNIAIRYISYLFIAGLITSLYAYLKSARIQGEFGRDASIAVFDFILYFSLLAVLSCELVTWMDLLGYPNSDKYGMSILWGAYALAMVALGIYTAKQYLRIGAIVLLGVTLAKLFLYDISELSTVARTVVFVSLGILMLIVSFLYNKYRSVIFGPNESA